MQECFDLILEEKLSMFLILLKIFPNLKGYDLIKEGAKRIVNNKDKKVNIATGLYQEMADDFNMKQEIIDRSMRHCVDVCFKRNGFVDFEKFFSVRFTSVKPRPKELLCVLAERANIEAHKELVKLNFNKF